MDAKVIVIAGPTCSGKTDLALILAEKLNGEIISADSRQIYKYLDIGTAKPSSSELESIFHYFINILEPDQQYNASMFENDALETIKKITGREKVPVVVGGSGLYIKALVDGIFDIVGTDEIYREHLLQMKKERGNEFLYKELQKVDPESSSKMLPQNWKRIMRALEVYRLSGKTIGELQKEYKREVDFNFVQFGLKWERSVLYRNIEKRVDKMIKDGLVEETEGILAKGFDKNLNSLNTVGYKEIITYLEGGITLDRAVDLIKRNTRRFAKRQVTWFGADNRITWFEINPPDTIIHPENDLKKIADEIIRREGLYERKN